MSEKVKRSASKKGLIFLLFFGALMSPSVFIFGVSTYWGLGGLVATVVWCSFALFRYPNTFVVAGPNGVRKYEAWKISDWTLWERDRKITWNDIFVVDVLFEYHPKAYMSIEGTFETNGETVHDRFEMPISPIPNLYGAADGGDEVVDYVAEHAPRERLNPDTIEYLQRRGRFDPERHPSKEECGAQVSEFLIDKS